MIRVSLVAAVILLSVPAWAQTVTTVPTDASSLGGAPVKRLLQDGFEVKTGFSDNNGGAYMVLQKSTSAYMCHSNPTQTCEKLN